MTQQPGMFQDILSSLFDRRFVAETISDKRCLEVLCNELLISRGEVSGFTISRTILDRIENSDSETTPDLYRPTISPGFKQY